MCSLLESSLITQGALGSTLEGKKVISLCSCNSISHWLQGIPEEGVTFKQQSSYQLKAVLSSWGQV